MGKLEINAPQDRDSEFEPQIVKKIQKYTSEIEQKIIILCADGLSCIKKSINVAFPNTEYQRCIVHQVRNTLKYVFGELSIMYEERIGY